MKRLITILSFVFLFLTFIMSCSKHSGKDSELTEEVLTNPLEDLLPAYKDVLVWEIATAKDTLPDIFTDQTCSTLKAGITKEKIESITTREYRELAEYLFNNVYDLNGRVQYYRYYPHPQDIAKENKNRAFNLLDNPTGIYVEKEENIVVFVGEMKPKTISMYSVFIPESNSILRHEYILKEGINILQAKDEGLLYIKHNDKTAEKDSIKIHIASGKVNGYFDIIKHTNKDWNRILKSAKSKNIDVLGKYAHLTFPVVDFKLYTPDVEKLINTYDSIVFWESKFTGLEKYNRANKNRMYFQVFEGFGFMWAMNYRTAYHKKTMRELCNPWILRSSSIWGPAHEVGHMHQTQGFKWAGLGEVTNNIYTMYVQQQFGNESRLYTEYLNSDFDGIWSNRYEKGFTEITSGKISHMMHNDVFCKLIPFWQLELYNSGVKGYKDFYADVHEQIRINPLPKTDAAQQFQFMKICCDVSQTDFTDFFTKWGMLIPFNGKVAELNSSHGSYDPKNFLITKKQIEDFKKYASQYPKPDQNIQYIHDKCVDVFCNKGEIKEGRIDRRGDKVEMNGWENVIVYKIYDNDQLILITPFSSFILPAETEKVIIHAVPQKGDAIIKTI